MRSATIGTHMLKRAAQPQAGRAPRVIFCGSTGDLPDRSRARNVRWLARGTSLDARELPARPVLAKNVAERCSKDWQGKRSAAGGVTGSPQRREVSLGPASPSSGFEDKRTKRARPCMH